MFARQPAIRPRLIRSRCVAAAAGILLVAAAKVSNADASWRAEFSAGLGSQLDIAHVGGSTAFFDSARASASIRISKPGLPVAVGVIGDYRFAGDGRLADSWVVGTGVKFEGNRWNNAGFGFYSNVAGGAFGYAYFSTFSLNDHHGLSVEIIGLLQSSAPPNILFGYYTDLTPTLSLAVGAGPASGLSRGLSGKLALTWSLF